jgi:hypothetical protein
MDDTEAWNKYPRYRDWMNKLWFSMKMGYDCGPSGVPPSRDGHYIVRPIYNLSGMGLGAKKEFIRAGDVSIVPPGYFWCEWFEGTHYSATYGPFNHDKKGYWQPKHCFSGDKDENSLTFFKVWRRVDDVPELPRLFHELSSIPTINVEFIGHRPIEVHLRDTPDPLAAEFIPIWKGQEKMVDIYTHMGYSYIESYDDADGFLDTPRIGFVLK